MLSRVAESIFWMSRYLERAENVARFLDVNHNLTLVLEDFAEQWSPLIYTTGDEEDFHSRYEAATKQNVIRFLAFDKENPNSILSCLRQARENARQVRENISADMWEELNKCFLMAREVAHRGDAAVDPHSFLSHVKLACQTLVGITDGTMSHDEGWHFARIGRLLERADKTSRVLDVKYYILLPRPDDVGSPIDIVQWSALLQSTSALEMYRRRFGRITPNQVAAFLILDRDFPRSMLFCLRRAEDSLNTLSGVAEGDFTNPAEQKLGRLRSELSYLRAEDIIDQGMHEFIDRFQTSLNQLGAAIHQSYFAAISASSAPAGLQEQRMFQ